MFPAQRERTRAARKAFLHVMFLISFLSGLGSLRSVRESVRGWQVGGPSPLIGGPRRSPTQQVLDGRHHGGLVQGAYEKDWHLAVAVPRSKGRSGDGVVSRNRWTPGKALNEGQANATGPSMLDVKARGMTRILEYMIATNINEPTQETRSVYGALHGAALLALPHGCLGLRWTGRLATQEDRRDTIM